MWETAVFALFCLSSAYAAIRTDVYHIDSGPIRGLVENDVMVFRGVPFGAPTSGANRWRAPQTVTPWKNTLDCFTNGHVCPQLDVNDGRFLGDEDCLFLDVYVPQKTSKTPRPVLFWIYGGGYVIGDNWEFGKYDAKNITKSHDYIVVAPNYRLGNLGFLALDQLKAEDPDSSTGNYGTMDQTAALRWVQRNIKVFGGDPTKVTIFGESAGAFSVCFHLGSQNSAGLFRAAIMESGTCDSSIFFTEYSKALAWSLLLTSHIGTKSNKTCDSNSPDFVSCLRSLEAMDASFIPKNLYHEADIPMLYPVMPWGPTIDGSRAGLTATPLEVLQAGKGNFVPHIAGINHNEGSIFIPAIHLIIPGLNIPMREPDIYQVLDHFFCANLTVRNMILQMYPLQNYKNCEHQGAMILRDYFFACPTKRALKATEAANASYPYMYHFYYEMHYPIDPTFGDYHSSELNFVFDNPWPIKASDSFPRNWNSDDQKMASIFGKYWSNMDYNLNPNVGESVDVNWPIYNSSAQLNILLDVPSTVEGMWLSQQCQMWDQIYSDCRLTCGC